MAIDNKDKKVLNVPHLRFPEFSGEWKKYSFNDIAQYKKGPFGSALKKEIFVPKSADSVKIYEQQNAIKKDWELGRYYISRDYFINHMQQFIVEAGDIIVSCAGTIGEIYELPPNAVSGVFNQALMRVRINATLIDKNIFIKVFSSMIDSFSKIYSNGSAIKNIPPFADLKKTNVFLPTQNEQYKISRLISLLDERIATQNKIIEKLQSLIKGLAAQLTQSGTPNIRLCDCLECHSSTLQENCVSVTGSYPVYGATGLIGYTNNYAYNGESILIVKDGSGVGSLSYVNDHFSVIGTLNYLTAKENYSILYLYYALMAFNFTPYITGMAIPHIYFKDYGKAKLFYPSIEKRIRIASLLHNIEQKLVVEQNLVISLSAQKSYLLRMLFI